MPEPVIAAAAENGKKKRPAHIRLAGGRAEAHAENGKKKRLAHIRLAGGRAEAHAENGKKKRPAQIRASLVSFLIMSIITDCVSRCFCS